MKTIWEWNSILGEEAKVKAEAAILKEQLIDTLREEVQVDNNHHKGTSKIMIVGWVIEDLIIIGKEEINKDSQEAHLFKIGKNHDKDLDKKIKMTMIT